MAVADIKPGNVRTWRKELIDGGTSEVTAAKAYRLLKTIPGTAADDGAIRRNPCRLKGAGTEQSAERRMLTVPQVFAFVEVLEPRYRAFVLLGTFASLRWGELCALRRCDIDLETRTIRVERSLTELQNGALAFGPPKTDAGKRTVTFPALILPALRWHINCFAQEDDDGLIFTSAEGTAMRRSNFRRRVWLPALDQAAVPIIHFHDLRHTGNTLTANAGANLRELMLRMGHTSPRAAMIYLHSTDARQREIADALGDLAASELKRAKSKRSGTQRARRRNEAS